MHCMGWTFFSPLLFFLIDRGNPGLNESLECAWSGSPHRGKERGNVCGMSTGRDRIMGDMRERGDEEGRGEGRGGGEGMEAVP